MKTKIVQKLDCIQVVHINKGTEYIIAFLSVSFNHQIINVIMNTLL